MKTSAPRLQFSYNAPIIKSESYLVKKKFDQFNIGDKGNLEGAELLC